VRSTERSFGQAKGQREAEQAGHQTSEKHATRTDGERVLHNGSRHGSKRFDLFGFANDLAEIFWLT
jgi:hypothetical protein